MQNVNTKNDLQNKLNNIIVDKFKSSIYLVLNILISVICLLCLITTFKLFSNDEYVMCAITISGFITSLIVTINGWHLFLSKKEIEGKKIKSLKQYNLFLKSMFNIVFVVSIIISILVSIVSLLLMKATKNASNLFHSIGDSIDGVSGGIGGAFNSLGDLMGNAGGIAFILIIVCIAIVIFVKIISNGFKYSSILYVKLADNHDSNNLYLPSTIVVPTIRLYIAGVILICLGFYTISEITTGLLLISTGAYAIVTGIFFEKIKSINSEVKLLKEKINKEK